MTDFYVYIITDRLGVPVYVGKGRGRRHNLSSRRSAKIEALISFGGTLPPVKIREGLTQTEAFECEKALIAFHGRECDGGTLLNVALGGPGASGVKHSAEAIEKTAAAHRGRKRSPETGARISAAKSGKSNGPHSAATRAKIGAANRLRDPELAARVMAAARAGQAAKRVAKITASTQDLIA
jgi:NUMOD3 motif-containing protein